MSDLKGQFEKHEERDDVRFNEIGGKLDLILTNHLPHAQIAYEKAANDIWWIKVIGGTLITGVISIIMKLYFP